MRATFECRGKIPEDRDRLKTKVRGLLIAAAHSLRSRLEVLSGPHAFQMLRCSKASRTSVYKRDENLNVADGEGRDCAVETDTLSALHCFEITELNVSALSRAERQRWPLTDNGGICSLADQKTAAFSLDHQK